MKDQKENGTDAAILKELSDGPMSTARIAEAIGEGHSRVYRRCRRLQDEVLISSTLVAGRRLLFCLDCEEVVTQENYPECVEQGHEFRVFRGKKRIWRLKE